MVGTGYRSLGSGCKPAVGLFIDGLVKELGTSTCSALGGHSLIISESPIIYRETIAKKT